MYIQKMVVCEYEFEDVFRTERAARAFVQGKYDTEKNINFSIGGTRDIDKLILEHDNEIIYPWRYYEIANRKGYLWDNYNGAFKWFKYVTEAELLKRLYKN